ncbi:hypothetical protein QK911_01610 [Lactococcus lactis]
MTVAQTQELIDDLQEMPFSPKNDYLISGLKGAYYPEGISKEYLAQQNFIILTVNFTIA